MHIFIFFIEITARILFVFSLVFVWFTHCLCLHFFLNIYLFILSVDAFSNIETYRHRNTFNITFKQYYFKT